MKWIPPQAAGRPPITATLLALLVLAAAPLHAAPPEPASAATRPADAPVASTSVESGWILERLARPAPTRTAFVELRGSALLKAPLRISGEYQRPDEDTLVREVGRPYHETTTIRDGTVRIVRDGRSPRTFPLSRAPELAALQESFGALLSGDRKRLERHYRVASSGPRERWALTLTPRDAALAERLRDITLYGRGAELRCIETRSGDDDTLQRTLLAGAARAATTRADDELAALCRGDRATPQ